MRWAWVEGAGACTYRGRAFAGEEKSSEDWRRARILACLQLRAGRRYSRRVGWWLGVVVIGFGVVKRKTCWRFQVASDVVRRCVCDGGGEWSGVERVYGPLDGGSWVAVVYVGIAERRGERRCSGQGVGERSQQ